MYFASHALIGVFTNENCHSKISSQYCFILSFLGADEVLSIRAVRSIGIALEHKYEESAQALKSIRSEFVFGNLRTTTAHLPTLLTTHCSLTVPLFTMAFRFREDSREEFVKLGYFDFQWDEEYLQPPEGFLPIKTKEYPESVWDEVLWPLSPSKNRPRVRFTFVPCVHGLTFLIRG